MPKVAVKKADAEKVLAAIKQQFKPWTQDLVMGDADDGSEDTYVEGKYQPVLVKDYEGYSGITAPYAIVWEDGAPYDWPQFVHGGRDEEFGFKVEAIEVPEGIFTEPISNIVLGLYEGGF